MISLKPAVRAFSCAAYNGCYGKLKLISPHVNKFVVLCLG